MEITGDFARLSEEDGQVLVRLARKAIAEKLHPPKRQEKKAGLGEVLPASLTTWKRGVFVTLHLGGQLRGCIGNLSGTKPLAEGVRDNAINAAFNDFRFTPVTAGELEEINVEVSILSEPRPLAYAGAADLVARLRPGIDGVIIKKKGASATFLPQVWQQLPEAADFLSHLCLKAGLPGSEWQRGGLEVATYQVQYFAEEKRSPP